MGDDQEQTNSPWDVELLTSTQARVLSDMERCWASASGPTVIHLVGPETRGKTHVVQILLENLVSQGLVGRPSPVGQDEFPWRHARDWRAARRTVESTPAIARATSGWLWAGCRLVPERPSDLLGNLRSIARDMLLTPPGEGANADRALETSGDDWAKLVAKTAIQVSLEQIPYLGTARAIAEAGRAFKNLKDASSEPAAALGIARDLERDLPKDLLSLMAICRLASPLEGAALPQLLLIIDDAQFLSQADFTGLTDLLAADPDELLSASGLPDSLKRALRQLGMPPRFPLVLLLVEGISTRGEEVAGPFGRPLKSQAPAETSIDHWVKQLNDQPERVPIHKLDRFPLFTTDEADEVVAHLEHRISMGTRRTVLTRSHDLYLGGHNIALLRSHLDRLADLRNPDSIDVSWIERHLSTHLQTEVEVAFAGLSRPARQAILASSLIGFGFAGSSVDELLDEDCSTGLAEAEARGLILRRPFRTSSRKSRSTCM